MSTVSEVLSRTLIISSQLLLEIAAQVASHFLALDSLLCSASSTHFAPHTTALIFNSRSSSHICQHFLLATTTSTPRFIYLFLSPSRHISTATALTDSEIEQ